MTRTNNGLMHVLDRIMSPLDSNDTATSTSSATTFSAQATSSRTLESASQTATVSVTVTATPSASSVSAADAAPVLTAARTNWLWSLAALIGGMLV